MSGCHAVVMKLGLTQWKSTNRVRLGTKQHYVEPSMCRKETGWSCCHGPAYAVLTFVAMNKKEVQIWL